MVKEPDTFFLPARRLSRDRILALAREIAASPASASLALVPMGVTIINETRQIVYANDRFTQLVGATAGFASLAGLRLGEALGCAHAHETEGGCGTTRFCQYCGAARAIVQSLNGTADTQECAITRRSATTALEALNLQVWAAPFTVGSHTLVLNSILDIAHEKNLRGFERMFFHDILNALTGIKGLHDIFSLELGEQYSNELDLLQHAIRSVWDVVESHKDFHDVEAREYQPRLGRIDTVDFLGSLADLARTFPTAKGKNVTVDPNALPPTITSDQRILERVVLNMLKNALEASHPGDEVSLGCTGQDQADGGATFWVHNPAVMPEETRMRIFERAFSTKGPGRGFGTYGMRLFAETCLGGTVRFTSEPGAGTTFFLELPR